ncbi:MAG: hypothetical protein WA637_01725 [Terriglobales bacterium]
MFLFALAVTSLLVSSQLALAQDGGPDMNMSWQGSSMPGMAEGEMGDHQMSMKPQSLTASLLQHATSGTDAEPDSTPIPMLMTTRGRWTLMLHGEAFLSEAQQSGPRGRGKLFSTNWWMPMAQRKFGKGTLTLRTMLSFEPATVTERRYPELFQEGETAFGRPIVDGQHPHDFFMELAALYDYKISEHTMVSAYAAPMGDPAMGPVAYPHRASASEDPIAPLGHHLQDSTHIAADVVTLGLTHRSLRVEASGFHGREPDEFRWNINSGKIDSWSARVTANPGQNWSLQYSIAQLHSPEELAPAEDIRRMTASIQYNRPLRKGNWASMVVWGRNQDVSGGNVGNSYLLESTLRFFDRNHAWTRIENVDRTNELLLGGGPEPPGFTERYFTRVQAYSAGYEREVGHIPHLSTALGGQVTWYGVPDVLQPIYGRHPVGGILFLRLRTQ